MRHTIFGLLTALLGVAGLLALVVGVGLWQFRHGQRHLQRWARQEGWQYSADAEAWRPVARRLTFAGGHLGPSVWGSFDGWQATAFRVRPKADSVDSQTYAVVAIALPVALPELSLRPRTWASSLVAALGTPEMRTGDTAFDDLYLVQAHDHLIARRILRPPLTERLLQIAPTPIIVVDRWVITWTATRDVPGAITRKLPIATWLAGEFVSATRT